MQQLDYGCQWPLAVIAFNLLVLCFYSNVSNDTVYCDFNFCCLLFRYGCTIFQVSLPCLSRNNALECAKRSLGYLRWEVLCLVHQWFCVLLNRWLYVNITTSNWCGISWVCKRLLKILSEGVWIGRQVSCT